MGKRIGHTIGSLQVAVFAKTYENKWHTYRIDRRTKKAVERAEFLGAVAVDRTYPDYPRFKYNRRAE